MQVSTADLAAYILRLCREQIHSANGPGLIAVTGKSCSGKSLLARQIGWHARSLGFEVTLHHLTDYMRPSEEWQDDVPPGEAYYERAFDSASFIEAAHRDAASRRDGTPGFVIAEGEFLLQAKFRTLWDFSIWIDADDDLVVERASTREFDGVNAEEIMAMRSVDGIERVYREYCLPAAALHEERDRPREHASVVVESVTDGWVLRDPEYAEAAHD